MAKKPVNDVFIQRLVNRRVEKEEKASLIWVPGATETDADFQTRREAWFAKLFVAPRTELEKDIPDSAAGAPPQQKHEGSDSGTWKSDLGEAIKKSHKTGSVNGPFLAAYQRVRTMIQQIVDHEIVECNTHLLVEVQKAYRAGYQQGHNDAPMSFPDQGWTAYKPTVVEYDPDATLHHTY